MKIKDLLEAPIRFTRTDHNMTATQNTLAQSGERLGGGYFAAAYTSPSDVEQVTKISKLNKDKFYLDGYYQYIKQLKKIVSDEHNRFLPVIYDVKRMIPPEPSKPYLLVTLERLFEPRKLNIDELYFVVGDMIAEDDEQEIREHVTRCFRNADPSDTYYLKELIVYILTEEINKATGRFVPAIQNEELLEALSIVKDLYNKGYSLDIHAKNFMFRRTPYGPQLVLTDPLAFAYNVPIRSRMI